jgi:hypothetical protein
MSVPELLAAIREHGWDIRVRSDEPHRLFVVKGPLSLLQRLVDILERRKEDVRAYLHEHTPRS